MLKSHGVTALTQKIEQATGNRSGCKRIKIALARSGRHPSETLRVLQQLDQLRAPSAGSCKDQNIPSLPSLYTSGIPPTGAAATGVPEANASISTMPKLSMSELCT